MVDVESSDIKNSPIAVMDVEKINREIALKEVILTVPLTSPDIIMNLLPVCSSTSRYNHQRLSCTTALCRICHEDEGGEELVSPCQCAGTLGLAHASCIEKWLSSSNTTTCEICKHEYRLSRQPKSMYEWLHSGTSHHGPSGLYGDLFCLVLLTPLCIVSVYLCAVGAKVYIVHGLWEGTGLALLCCFLMAVYVLWCFVTVRFHWKRLKRWQSINQSVKLTEKFHPGKKVTLGGGSCTVEVTIPAAST